MDLGEFFSGLAHAEMDSSIFERDALLASFIRWFKLFNLATSHRSSWCKDTVKYLTGVTVIDLRSHQPQKNLRELSTEFFSDTGLPTISEDEKRRQTTVLVNYLFCFVIWNNCEIHKRRERKIISHSEWQITDDQEIDIHQVWKSAWYWLINLKTLILCTGYHEAKRYHKYQERLRKVYGHKEENSLTYF